MARGRVYDEEYLDLGYPDGWPSWAELDGGMLRINIGCRLGLSLARARKRWRGVEDRREVLAALDYAEAVARLRGWRLEEKKKKKKAKHG